jgi:hypothetical protein
MEMGAGHEGMSIDLHGDRSFATEGTLTSACAVKQPPYSTPNGNIPAAARLLRHPLRTMRANRFDVETDAGSMAWLSSSSEDDVPLTECAAAPG